MLILNHRSSLELNLRPRERGRNVKLLLIDLHQQIQFGDIINFHPNHSFDTLGNYLKGELTNNETE